MDKMSFNPPSELLKKIKVPEFEETSLKDFKFDFEDIPEVMHFVESATLFPTKGLDAIRLRLEEQKQIEFVDLIQMFVFNSSCAFWLEWSSQDHFEEFVQLLCTVVGKEPAKVTFVMRQIVKHLPIFDPLPEGQLLSRYPLGIPKVLEAFKKHAVFKQHDFYEEFKELCREEEGVAKLLGWSASIFVEDEAQTLKRYTERFEEAFRIQTFTQFMHQLPTTFIAWDPDQQQRTQAWIIGALKSEDVQSKQEVEQSAVIQLVMKIQQDRLSRLDDLLNFCWEWWLTHKDKIDDPNVRQRFLQIFHFKSWQRFEECAELYTGKTIDVDLPQMIGKQYDRKKEGHLMEHRRLLCAVGLMSNYTEHISNVRFAFHPSLIEECRNTELKSYLQSLKEDPKFYEEQVWSGTAYPRLPAIVCNIKDKEGCSYVMWIYIDLMSPRHQEKLRMQARTTHLTSSVHLLKTEKQSNEFTEPELFRKIGRSEVYTIKLRQNLYQAFVFYAFRYLGMYPNKGINKDNKFRGSSVNPRFMIDGLPNITGRVLEDFYKKYPEFPR